MPPFCSPLGLCLLIIRSLFLGTFSLIRSVRMPMLSSFIPYRPKLKTKSSKSPFSIRRLDSLSAPHPYASPGIFDISDDIEEQQIPPHLQKVDVELHPQPHPTEVVDAPGVKLDIETSPSPLKDWFPSDFLKSEPLTLTLAGESILGIESGRNGNGETTGNKTGASGSGMKSEGDHNGTTEEHDDEDDKEYTSESTNMEEFVANLEAMDVRCGLYSRLFFRSLLNHTRRPPTS